MNSLSVDQRIYLIFGIAAVLATFLTYAKLSNDNKLLSRSEKIKIAALDIFFTLFEILILGAVSYSFIWSVNVVRSYDSEIIDFINSPYTVVLGVMFALLLFKLKNKNPRWYGMLEMAVAITVIYFSTQKTEENLGLKIISISGGIYIFVRGLDNFGKNVPVRMQKLWRWMT